MIELITNRLKTLRKKHKANSDRALAEALSVTSKQLETGYTDKPNVRLLEAIGLKRRRVKEVLLHEHFGGKRLTMSEFADFVSRQVEASGLSVTDWCQEHGVPRSAYGFLQKGTQSPGPAMFAAFDATDVSYWTYDEADVITKPGEEPMYGNLPEKADRQNFLGVFERKLKREFKGDLGQAADHLGTTIDQIERVLGTSRTPNQRMMAWVGMEKRKEIQYVADNGEVVDTKNALQSFTDHFVKTYANEREACDDLNVPLFKLREMLKGNEPMSTTVQEQVGLAAHEKTVIRKKQAKHQPFKLPWGKSTAPTPKGSDRLRSFLQHAEAAGDDQRIKLISLVVTVYKGREHRAALDMKITQRLLTRMMSGGSEISGDAVLGKIKRHGNRVVRSSEVLANGRLKQRETDTNPELN